jgi:DNA-binding CsgD family transcriptional regulator
MGDVEQVSSLIGDIHDAALNPALWPTVLTPARQFVGGSAAVLFSTGAGGPNVCCGALDSRYRRQFFDSFAKLHPCAAGLASARNGEPVGADDLLLCGAFRDTRFFRDWAQPQSFIDFVCAVLDKATGTLFCILRRERDGPIDEAARGRLRLIAQHLRRAVEIGRAVDRNAAKAQTLADILDGLSAGLFLVDAAGRLVHANARGRAMLRDRSVLSIGGGRLAAGEVAASQALYRAFASAGAGKAACGVEAVPLTARTGERYVAHLLPLGSRSRPWAGTDETAVAALFVRKVALEAPPPEALARTFSLTPGELRVLFTIVEVGGVPEAAEALGIAEATVKTHLHRLFCKTGAVRQADLVKLVAGFANPVGGLPSPTAVPVQPIGGREAAARLASWRDFERAAVPPRPTASQPGP